MNENDLYPNTNNNENNMINSNSVSETNANTASESANNSVTESETVSAPSPTYRTENNEMNNENKTEMEKNNSGESFKKENMKTLKNKMAKVLIPLACLALGLGTGLLLSNFKPNDISLQEITDTITEEKTEIVYRDTGDVSDIVDSAMDSIVAISSTTEYQQFNFFTGLQSYEASSSGSGIIVGKNNSTLYIATNNHVIEGTNGLTVEFSDGTSATATVNGSSSDTDIAVITVNLSDISTETLSKIKVASLHTEDDLKVGNQVIAIGNALGYGQSVTVGYISALDRSIQTQEGTVSGLIQTDAAINPGNSGGALLNMNGEVIGINVAKYADTEVEGVGYSIPISKIQGLIDMLSKEKVPDNEKGSLGIQCTAVDNQMAKLYDMPQGVFVYGITNEKLAEEGLLEKDIITAINGHTILSPSDLISYLDYYKKGETVTLSVKRLDNGEYIDKEVTATLIDNSETEKK